MSYYRNAFIGEALGLVLALALSMGTSRWQQLQRRTLLETGQQATQLAHAKMLAEEKLEKMEREGQELLTFEKAWDAFRRPAPANDLGNHLRNKLATLATQAGLTSEGTTVAAEAKNYPVGGATIRIQEVSINVTSESLPALLTWLGEVEGQFPYARVESLSLTSYASHSVQLGITLYHPVEQGERFSQIQQSLPDVARK